MSTLPSGRHGSQLAALRKALLDTMVDPESHAAMP